MSIDSFVAAINEEIQRLTIAHAALLGTSSRGQKRSRRARVWFAEARARQAQFMKARWAARKKPKK